MEEDQCAFDDLAAMLDDDGEMNAEDEAEPDKAAEDGSEDQCGIDDLSAMLDEDQEDKVASSATTTHKATVDDSSDDDIDEDELDQLAALVEEEEADVPPASVPDDGGQPSTARRQDQQITQTGQASKLTSDTSPTLSVTTQQDTISTDTLDNSQTKVEDEVKLMQERIKQLERMLQQQNAAGVQQATSQPAEPVKKVSASTQPITRVPAPPTQISAKSSQISKKTQSTPNTAATSKIKTLEEDIFFSSSTSDVTANSGTASDKSKSSSLSSSFYGNKAKTKVGAKDDSDSDWEDLDGEKPDNLSAAGRDIDRLLKKGGRVAHTPRCDPVSTPKAGPKEVDPRSTMDAYLPPFKDESRKPRDTLLSRTPGIETSYDTLKTRNPKDDKVVITEEFSNIRIVKPLVSSTQMRTRMEGKNMIKLSRLHTKVNSPMLEGNWVTVAVVISKSETKTSAKGNSYSIWKLSDLDDCDKVVSFFLFKDVYKTHWKMAVGSVIGLLNGNIMKNTEKYKARDPKDVSLTVEFPKQVMPMGRSKDFGLCKGKTKAGRDCTNFLNLQRGEYCSYHVQKAYKKSSAGRAELQSHFSGVAPKSFEKTLFGKGGTVSYGGVEFSTRGHSVKKPTNQVTMKSLQQHHVSQGPQTANKVNTLKLHDVLPGDKEKLEKLNGQDKHKEFHDLLSVPTPGSMQYVKFLKKQEHIEEVKQKKVTSMKSVTVSQFMKTMNQEHAIRKQQRHSPAGNENTASRVPQLGRGFMPGQAIEFDLGSPTGKIPLADKQNARSEALKRKALAKIKAKGGLEKHDPNALANKKSSKVQEKVKKRLAEAMSDSPVEEGEETHTPAKKKSRLLGGLDLDSPEVQKVLKAKSSHEGLLTEAEQERQDEYFEVLEKKEQMEEKMSSIQELACKAYICKQCKYKAMYTSKKCKEEGHKIDIVNATKRFFECKDCKRRTVCLEKYPVLPCKQCGGRGFNRSSMHKERKGPKLAKDEFLEHLRGEERTFVNS